MGEKVIKIFASDLDGTFFNSQKNFDKNLFTKILKKIELIDGRFIIATGREPALIKTVFADFLENPIVDFMANNGAYVTANHKVVQYNYIDENTVKAVWDFFEEFEQAPDKLITFSTLEHVYIPKRFLEPGQTHLLNVPVEITPIDSADQIKGKVMKIACVWKELNESADQLTKQLQAQFGDVVHATQSGFGTIDIISGDVNKAQGLSVYAQTLSIKPEEIAAFGDNDNDLEMLNYVGKPFVMPNAPERILSIGYPKADDDNENSGVLKTIERITENNHE